MMVLAIASYSRPAQHRSMTLLILLLLLAVVIGVVTSGKRVPPDRRAPMLLAPPNPDNEEESAVDLSLHDPVEPLLRYGNPDDAARLAEQGVDVKGLGYRPPER